MKVWTKCVLLIGIIGLHIFAVHVSDGIQVVEILTLLYFARR